MADIFIDVSDDEDDAVVAENAELSWIDIRVSGCELRLRWEQAANLHTSLCQFFEESKP